MVIDKQLNILYNHVTGHVTGNMIQMSLQSSSMPPHSQYRTTIRQVAVCAGVSHQTVSRVINGSERVSPETKARVETAITELGYTPNAIARYMAQGRTRTFACISPNLTDYTFASIIEGAEIEARRHGYFIITASAPDEEAFGTLVDQLVSSRRTEGLMVINPYADDRHKHLPKEVPTVFMGARPRQEAVDSVSLDDVEAARIATQHLLDLGHRRIALITGLLCEDCSEDRQIGYADVLRRGRVHLDPALILEGDWSATSGYHAVQQLLLESIPFTAVFAQNDRMAVGAIRALREAGKRIPEDISVIGFDDMPLASYFDPPLTTMGQDMFKMGSEAVKLLMRAIEQPESPRQHLRLPAALITRRSTSRIN